MKVSGRSRIVVAVFIAIAGLALSLPAGAESTTVTYTANVVVPVAPSSNFSGSAGGDGWDVALTPTAVYNVFHHASQLNLACHLQVDASKCWDTDSKVITDGSGNNFTGPMHSGIYLDQATGKLHIYSTRTSDSTAGVVCVDTNQPPATLFCGFTPLSAVGDGGLTSLPMKVGSNLYAFNYNNGTPSATGTRNTLMCFSLTSAAACAGQPFSVDVGAGSYTIPTFPVPATAAIGGRILVPATLEGTSVVGCFDPGTGTECAGSWPTTVPANSNGSAFPLLDGAGTTIGFCLPTAANECFDLNGASVATPAGMTAVIGANSRWNGAAVVIGARIYVPNGNVNQVACFNYATGAGCTNFPKVLSNLSLLYTVNVDPQRPACLWVNADSGSAQIQNFDAFSGASCGQGAIRVLSASFVAPSVVCAPSTWRSLVVNAPARDQYASGSVEFQDSDANPIPGVASQAIGANGGVDLSSLALTSTLPQFLVTLDGLAGPLGEVVMTLTWDATYDPACLSANVTALAPPAPTTTVPQPAAPTTTVPQPAAPTTTPVATGILPETGNSNALLASGAFVLIVLGAGLVFASVRFRTER